MSSRVTRHKVVVYAPVACLMSKRPSDLYVWRPPALCYYHYGRGSARPYGHPAPKDPPPVRLEGANPRPRRVVVGGVGRISAPESACYGTVSLVTSSYWSNHVRSHNFRKLKCWGVLSTSRQIVINKVSRHVILTKQAFPFHVILT